MEYWVWREEAAVDIGAVDQVVSRGRPKSLDVTAASMPFASMSEVVSRLLDSDSPP